MTDYSKMTDFVINAAVGSATGHATAAEPALNLVIRNSNGRKFDPCNSWSDAGPIIVENKISLNAHGLHAWMAWKNTGSNLEEISSNRHQHSAIWGNPLRAAMIVFLMMKEAE